MKTHAIHWKSTVSGSIGTGTKLFEKGEAERLATELNEKYPEINHDAVIPPIISGRGEASSLFIAPGADPSKQISG